MTTVQIGDRKFRVGATYAPAEKRTGVNGYAREFRGLMPNPSVIRYRRILKHGDKSEGWSCSHDEWLRWAGDEVLP